MVGYIGKRETEVWEMNKFAGILFCTDIDGTLLNKERQLPKENVDAIEYFKSEGGLFTFITGRPPQSANRIYNMIKSNAPYGCINGGGVYDPVKQEYLWHCTLSRDALEMVAEVYEKLPDIGFQLNTESGIYFCRENATMARFRELSGVPNVVRPYDAVQEPILKVVFGHPEEEGMQALMNLLHNHPLADRFTLIRSERTLFEILPKSVNKGVALMKMAELLGIDPARTIAAGDYYNDVSMLKVAGAGFAVSNAVEEAKQAADYITVSNDENAIAAIIDLLDRGELKI